MNTPIIETSADSHLPRDESIRIRTIVRYLIGDRAAILRLASCGRTVWLGLLLVISAGFAREYDGEDLLREPWHLLLPLGASLVTSFLLFGLVYLVAIRRDARPGRFWGAYRSFLGLYWMTAPLAWLYAIPVERFLSAHAAVEMNIWLLGIVSLWRVALIIRVNTIQYNARAETVIPLVMFFADSVVLFILSVIPRPVPLIQVMGGIRMTESESAIAGATLLVGLIAGATYPIWILGTVIVFCSRQPGWSYTTAGTSVVSRGIDRSVWLTAVCSILVWGLFLPKAQSEQRLRVDVERKLRDGQLQGAVQIMSSHPIDDFPPHWDPPPHPVFNERSPRVVDLMELVADRPDDWIRQIFIAKFRRQLSGFHFSSSSLGRMDNDERLKVLTVLESLRDGDRLFSNGKALIDGEEDEVRRFDYLLETLIESKETDTKWSGCSPVSEDVREKARVLRENFVRSALDSRKKHPNQNAKGSD